MHKPWISPRQVDQPRPGFFEMRLVRGGPMVAAKITHDDGMYQAWIDGKPRGEPHADPVFALDVYRVWHSGREIDEAIYDFRLAYKAWAKANDPSHPALRPAEVIDLSARKPLF